jgi:L-aminopeptidase/D-esterase-like protein
VQALLRERGRGFAIGDIRVPLVCGAALFDLLNGGDKNWGRFAPYRDLGYAAGLRGRRDVCAGTAGAGFGATTVNLKGGLGSASALTRDGHTVGALAAVNACGSANVGHGPHFWAPRSRSTASSAGWGFRPPCHLRRCSRLRRDARARTRPSPSSPPTRR